jgi:predicted peptidase
MKKIFFIFYLLFCVMPFANAQNFSVYQKHYFVKGKDSLPYRLLLPQNYDVTKKYPLILFLHGAGERGNDNESQLSHGADFFMRDSIRKKYPAIIIFPQCKTESFWSNVNRDTSKRGEDRLIFQTGGKPTLAMRLLRQLLTQVITNYSVEKKQIYVGGLSMGGMGTFEIVYRNPTLFAAAFPMCGGADVGSAPKFKKTNWWIFHGAKDDLVLPMFSQRIVTALQNIHANVKFTLYPEDNHNCWDSAFAESELMSWLFSNKK